MLDICKDILSQFEENGIKYCHWKSNEHLNEGLEGITDLDILIDRKKYNHIQTILFKLGFKRGNTLFYLNYCSIEDYIGFDNRTGRLIHLHLHFELMVGKKFIKGIRLPWEDYIFKSSYVAKDNPVYLIDPHIELILVFIRNYLKKNTLKRLVKNRLSKDDLIEIAWLSPQIDLNKLKNICQDLGLNELYNPLQSYLERDSASSYKKTQRCIATFFKSNYSYSHIEQDSKYFFYRFIAMKNYYRSKIRKKPYCYRRGLSEGGVVITFLGVDGSGKSTLIKEINKCFSWKFDIFSLYFGSGDGKSSLLRLPLKIIAQIRSKKRGNILDLSENEKIIKDKKIKFAKAIWALLLAKEKKKKFSLLLKARSNGMIILTDRYPQTCVKGYNDGPLLDHWKDSKSFLKKVSYNYEKKVYDLSNQFQPDIVLKLMINEELSAARKNDTPRYMIKKKINAINTISFPHSKEVLINTSGTVQESSLMIKQAIWDFLKGNEKY